jgi:penicillin-binding protein 1A
VVTEGTGRGASIWGHEAAGKTGTTQDYHDAWFVGFTTDYVTSVWVGNDDSSPMKTVTGGSLPATIWREVMSAAEKGLPAKPLDRSPEEPPAESSIFASGASEPAVTGDEEAGAAPSEEAQQRGEHHGFLDWLFGGGRSEAPPPSADDSN